jgi:hypothetical protein
MSRSTNQQVRRNARPHFRALRWVVMVDASGSSTYSTEDTFVLLDALEADADAIRGLAPRICLEIGRVRVCPLRVVVRAVERFSSTNVSLDREPASSQLSWVKSSALPTHVRTCSDLSLLCATKITHTRLFTPTPPGPTSLPLYGHQPTRSDVHRTYRVPKQGAATTIATFPLQKKNENK